MSDLNTTPLIDVMLVLLIMFIITIPVGTHVVPLQLPVGVAPLDQPSPLRNEIAIGADGIIRWNGRAVSDDALSALLARSVALPAEPELHVRPAAQARYDVVDRVLTLIKRAHVSRLGFVGNEHYAHDF